MDKPEENTTVAQTGSDDELFGESFWDKLNSYTEPAGLFNFLFENLTETLSMAHAALCVFDEDALICFRESNLEKESYFLTEAQQLNALRDYLARCDREQRVELAGEAEMLWAVFAGRFDRVCVYTVRRGGDVVGGLFVPLRGTDDPETLRRVAQVLDEVSLLLEKKLIFRSEKKLLKDKFRNRFAFGLLVGKSSAMRKVYDMVEEIAGTDITILIQGETGTGKELLARTIHEKSPRRDGPFVRAFCSAYTDSLIQSELFGHEKGAFTGASKQKTGRFEMARKGTLFLDEIGEINAATQVLLLRFLETREFERVGGEKTQTSNARIVAATNRDLQAEVELGTFRRDLYFRLNVVTITLPPLREKREDIPLLAKHFIHRFRRKSGKVVTGVSPETLDIFEQYAWPGNVRELKGVLERGFFLTKTQQIEPHDLPPHLLETLNAASARSASPEPEIEEPAGKQQLVAALEQCRGNKKAAAELLGISRPTLYQRLKRFGLSVQG